MHDDKIYTHHWIGPPDPLSNLRQFKFVKQKNPNKYDLILEKEREETHIWNNNFWTHHNNKFFEVCIFLGVSLALLEEVLIMIIMSIPYLEYCFEPCACCSCCSRLAELCCIDLFAIIAVYLCLFVSLVCLVSTQSSNRLWAQDASKQIQMRYVFFVFIDVP